MPISSVIAKPTRECNADCSYCCAPPDSGKYWTLNDFKRYFDSVVPELDKNAPVWIWHGGEPLLLDPKFYYDAASYARSIIPGIRFSVQSNLLAYSSKRWKHVFRDVFDGSVSTSYDPANHERTVKGSAELYDKLFRDRLDAIISDGFRPLVLAVIHNDNISAALELYEMAKRSGNFDLRFNYVYPAGRGAETNLKLMPKEYGQLLSDIFRDWSTGDSAVDIQPLSQMLDMSLGIDGPRCPWTRNCATSFLHIDPEGDLYTCGQMAGLEDKSLCYGNLNDLSSDPLLRKREFKAMLNGVPANKIRRREFDLPTDCKSCDHFKECKGGCQRDAALYGRGLGGKFYYCESWKRLFTEIKLFIAENPRSDLVMSRHAMPIQIIE